MVRKLTPATAAALGRCVALVRETRRRGCPLSVERWTRRRGDSLYGAWVPGDDRGALVATIDRSWAGLIRVSVEQVEPHSLGTRGAVVPLGPALVLPLTDPAVHLRALIIVCQAALGELEWEPPESPAAA